MEGSGDASSAAGEGGTRIVVAVCTFRRNAELDRLLSAVRRNVDHLPPTASVGVVVVDDNPDGAARPVCDRHADEFVLGVDYRTAGRGNISIARNVALDAAIPVSDWVAMTDDDCEPVDTWLAAYLEAQAATGADALTGPCLLDPGEHAPDWLVSQPFLHDGQLRFPDCAEVTSGATNNSFVRSSFLRERPWLRFDEDLGVVGGEDMVFFRTAHRDGLDIRFSAAAVVTGHEPVERTTYGHQLRSRYWLGNTEYITNATLGSGGRSRWVLLGARRGVAALWRPVSRLFRGHPPQIRYAGAQFARAAGNVTGAIGHRVRHH